APGIYRRGDRLYTVNRSGDDPVYGEDMVRVDGREYRRWDADRSKLAAAVGKGLDPGIEQDDEIIYLGAASGTTVSHLSDIVEDGFVVAVEYSKTVARDLVSLAEKRDNIAPVIADARKPEEYAEYVEDADVVYQDISQRDQAEILEKNCESFLEKGDTALVAVKA
ncbi:MAG: fibrillarin-like rRNA/tRNA 2'-O-methyltransferase, partial [Candidatus Nanohaloarchaea archaeon]